jgi:hypothetical protein
MSRLNAIEWNYHYQSLTQSELDEIIFELDPYWKGMIDMIIDNQDNK